MHPIPTDPRVISDYPTRLDRYIKSGRMDGGREGGREEGREGGKEGKENTTWKAGERDQDGDKCIDQTGSRDELPPSDDNRPPNGKLTNTF